MRIEFLSAGDIEKIHSTSLEILEKTGVLVRNIAALSLLVEAGCETISEVVRIPSNLVEECLKKTPSSFKIYSQDGEEERLVGEGDVIFNPGSSVSNVLDHKTGAIRKATSQDLIESIQITEVMDHISAQSTSMIPADIPNLTSDFYRLYTVLKYSKKPIISGAFRKEGIEDMLTLLTCGSSLEEWRKKPTAIFDCCPLSPLTWSDTSAQNLVDCACSGIPAEIVPAPLMGATSPITIAGTLAQTNAEILSGIVIAQLASSRSPVVYGGAPSPLDMILATPRYGSIESMMTACAAAEIGKHYGLPTHAYL
ncbi:MAG: trimethylamine methyltransferase family protein, partial [Candidatus Thorarchaeota archaeon]